MRDDGTLEGPYDIANGTTTPYYIRVPDQYGMRSNRMLQPDLFLFDVIVDVRRHCGGGDLTQVGQIAAKMSGPGLSLDRTQLWHHPGGPGDTYPAGALLALPR
jgi:hypothetical protein